MSINDDSRLVHSVADLRRTVGLAALLFVSVFAAASFSIALPRDGFLAPVWIANAFILSSLLATRRVIWPILVIVGALGKHRRRSLRARCTGPRAMLHREQHP